MDAVSWGARAPREASGRRAWLPPFVRDSLVYGILWGLAVWILETTNFAFTRRSLVSAAPLLCVIALFWITRGVALAIMARWLASRVRPVAAWVAFVPLTIVLSLAWDGFDDAVAFSCSLFGVDLPDSGMFLFTIWNMVVYGAPLFAFGLFDARSRHTRLVLAQAETARLQNAAAIDAARFELLARRVDPALLQHSLEEARQALASGDARAAQLLDALVELLRAAMPAVRGGSSTGLPVSPLETKGAFHEE